MFWMVEDDCLAAQGAASRNVQSGLDVYLCLRGLQPGAHAKPDGRHGSRAVSPGRSVSERRGNARSGRPEVRKSARKASPKSENHATRTDIARATQFFSTLLVLLCH